MLTGPCFVEGAWVEAGRRVGGRSESSGESLMVKMDRGMGNALRKQNQELPSWLSG